MSDQERIIKEMTEALEEAIEIQQRYSETLDKLEKENKFLSDTILQHKLGKITVERKELYKKMAIAKTEAEKALEDAKRVHENYDDKLERITILIRSIQDKHNNIDEKIRDEAEKMIEQTKQDLAKENKQYKSELKTEFKEKEDKMNRKIKVMSAIMAISMVVNLILMAFLIIR